MQNNALLEKSIRNIPDFPKPGILFRDITTLIKNKAAFKKSVDLLAKKYKGKEFDASRSLLPLWDFKFDASFFSTPYLDNTLLPNGTRFSVIYRGCLEKKEPDFVCRFPLGPARQPQGHFDVVIFKSDFLSRRDRPDIDRLLQKSAKRWPFF